MKHFSILALALILGVNVMAQESFDKTFTLSIGDTVVWKPYESCMNRNYKVSSKVIIDFKLIGYGDQVQVVGLKEGVATVKASCGEEERWAQFNVIDPTAEIPVVLAEKPEKPVTMPFTESYHFDSPADHFFITFAAPNSDFRETYAKIGKEEAHNDGQESDRFWNIETGKNWYYVPEFQGWTDDVAFDFEPFGESFFPINSFANEAADKDLSDCFVGIEKVLDIDCWHFFVEQADGNVIQYWVDPANGCTLRRQYNNEQPYEVTVYNLNFKAWFYGPHYKKSLHDKTH